jgi:hypothetical protein
MFRCRACGDSIMVVEANRRKKSSSPHGQIPHGQIPVLLSLAGSLVVLLMSYFAQAEMDGRWFLAFYGGVLIVCWGFSERSRARDNSWLPFVVTIATYVSVGVMRYSYGINHGMDKFASLFVMMIAGTTLIALGVDAVSGKQFEKDVKVYAILPGISVGLSVVCLLWTVAGPMALIVPFVLLGGLLGLFGRGGHGSGWGGSSCGGGGCGGGGCGGGGCGGCGG